MLAKGKSLRIELWGVRGSIPAPRPPDEERERLKIILDRAVKEKVKTPKAVTAFLRKLPEWETYGYGGNTSCVEITSRESHIIIDGGSGIRCLGERAMARRDQKEFHIFISHFHWDHLIGLPFFTPIFIPGYTINFYSVQPELEEMVRGMFKRPYFPVGFEDLKSKIVFHKIPERKGTQIGDMKVTPYRLDHPDPCFGFKVESNGKAYSHVVDTEATRSTAQELGPDLPLYQNIDLMLFDSQYTLKEAAEKIHWGHASAIIGLELALREGIKKILFVHHDPAAADHHIHEAEVEAQRAFESSKKLVKLEKKKVPKIDWAFAREGLVIEI